jgi:hypothetical protein
MKLIVTHQIRNAMRIRGKNLVFRDAAISDAAYILALRTDARKARHLSTTAPVLDRQIAWMKDYEGRSDQAYFIIENKAGEPLGTVRIYDPRAAAFVGVAGYSKRVHRKAPA